MPYPKKGQTKDEFLKSFLESAEAKSDYPDIKQRVAVAESIWENKK